MTPAERLAAAVEAAQAGEPVEEAARRYEIELEDVERALQAKDAVDDPIETLWQALMMNS